MSKISNDSWLIEFINTIAEWKKEAIKSRRNLISNIDFKQEKSNHSNL